MPILYNPNQIVTLNLDVSEYNFSQKKSCLIKCPIGVSIKYFIEKALRKVKIDQPHEAPSYPIDDTFVSPKVGRWQGRAHVYSWVCRWIFKNIVNLFELCDTAINSNLHCIDANPSIDTIIRLCRWLERINMLWKILDSNIGFVSTFYSFLCTFLILNTHW
jgi:hypothetical protein